MRSTLSWRRRLILGMSIEDARSKFDSPESRVALRLAHERYNQGLYHELTLAQRRRNQLPSERRCHLVRHTKPSVKGFQSYIKSCPDDYVVREIWRDDDKETAGPMLDATAAVVAQNSEAAISSAEGGSLKKRSKGHDANAEQTPPQEEHVVNSRKEAALDVLNVTPGKEDVVSAPAETLTPPSLPSHVGLQVTADVQMYKQHRAVVLQELARVANKLGSDARQQLAERRENGTLLAIRQGSVVDRLVDNVKEAQEKGYTSLSSSSHLLETINLSMNLCSKKDKELIEAFRSPFIFFPAEEHHISLSLWVAGNLIEHEELGMEFPYHLAKHMESEAGGDGAAPPPTTRLPKASIEIYFSPELYQLKQTLGMDGILALRRFIGRAMKRQHDPLPTTPSIVLNMRRDQQEACGICRGEATQVPWLHLIKAKVSTVTGTVLGISSDEAPTISAMREAIQLVWRIWGHLVKDLRVHGDLDYMYLSVWPQMETNVDMSQSSITCDERPGKALEGIVHPQDTKQGVPQQKKQQAVNSIRCIGDAVNGLMEGDSSIWKGFNSRKLQTKSIIVPTDFVVVECTLEKKGLPHRIVVEDVVESLTELQRQAMEMQRIAIVQARDAEEKVEPQTDAGSGGLRPVLYAPKVFVSHAGVIDAAAHSFQRIRIRGSCIAHVESLARALETGEHFTEREGLEPMYGNNPGSLISARNMHDAENASLLLPPNLSFCPRHHVNSTHATDSQLLGHRVPSNYSAQRAASGQFHRYQTLRPLQSMVVDKEEREFWGTHYYRLSDIRLVFHDRVSTADVENPKGWSPSLKERLLAISQSRNNKQSPQEGDEKMDAAGTDSVEDAEDTTARGKKSRKKKSKTKRAPSVTLDEVAAKMSPEKLFEFLCVDMEVESASYDFRVGDNDGYAYRVRLRCIPQNHIPLVKPAMQSLEEKGFINYFGPQRFASYTKQNMHPGLHLLKGEFRAAANIIVQQFYMDSDIAAEKRRRGAGFFKMYHSKAMGFRIPDHIKLDARRRSIAEHGTALQSILDSALQAAALLGEDEEKESSIDPCEEAFLRVVGPNACLMLVHEFLAFVWNDIVNQRFQRYGTFAVLPGDLVRRNPLASPHSKEYQNVVFASKSGIDKGKYTFSDVVLPLPGVGIRLPENHTTDLYIVTLQRMGILFNPESKQWDIFRPRRSFNGESSGQRVAGISSPYHRFSSSFALMEEELGNNTTIVEPIDGRDNEAGDDPGLWTTGATTPMDASQLRKDLRQGELPGNPLGVSVFGFYRHVLMNPSPTLRWQMQLDRASDPHQRWALGVRQAFAQPHRDILSVTENNTHNNHHQKQQQQQLFIGHSLLGGRSGYGNVRRRRGTPPAPYWLSKKNEACLDLSFELPSSVYPSMMLRELTKSDVNSPETVDLDGPLLDNRAKSWNDLRADQQATYKKHLAKKRQKLFVSRPRAINVALLHQHIFRSGGMRRSLLPSMRGYENVSK
ncbi:putative pseudouridine synthase TruD [Trypanosoma cruzi]|uniref:Putative pseudouridine synthase TruD n=2 Tax=Trypanosoma cruzi TaxID=5693 RepID=A0A2V2WJJ6_TRYCR|nr:putative pseudouridine synthase TruD [Trypanosoma cruzi]